jgi:5-methylcytosine-specific restriction protein A
MGRLSNLSPMVGGLSPRLARQADAQGHSQAVEPWRAWYKLARWRKLRWSILTRDLFTCQCGCGHLESDTSQLVADHIRPHRGNEALFWDPANLQTLAKRCHDRAKQAAEHRARRL